MRLIDRYICREIFSHALLGLTVFTFVLFVPQLVRLMELIIRHAADAPTVGVLFLCTLPGVFTFTLPMAVLVGVLIGLGRLSADSEIIALHALGIGMRRLLVPVGALAGCAALLTLAMSAWVGPQALLKFRALEEELRSSQASFEIQPRVFDERFPRLVLYVQDVEAAATRWRGIFLAETGAEDGSRLTLAEEAIVVADRERGKLQLSLRNGTTHEFSRRYPQRYIVTTFGQSDVPVTVTGVATRRHVPRSPPEMPLRDLLGSGEAGIERAVEFHRRIAFPAACLVFAFLAVPFGARPRRGGRAGGFVLTLLLICGYYLLLIFGTGLARRGTIPPALGVWGANLIAVLLGVYLLPRMEEVGEGLFARWLEAFASWRKRLRGPQARASAQAAAPNADSAPAAAPADRSARDAFNHPRDAKPARREGGLALLVDLYILKYFFNFFVLTLAGFLILFHAFTFFELINDIVKHQVPFLTVAAYFIYWTPQLFYQLVPLAVLVASVVTISALAKSNEITALKASGISAYRIATPLLLAGGALFVLMLALDSLYLPFTNQKQDALRNQIKGRPAKTYFQPRQQWIFGQDFRLYNYELFDPDARIFGGLNVFELDGKTFQLQRRVYAARAQWDEGQRRWNLEDGWVRDFAGSVVSRFTPFSALHLAELTEPPGYFLREVRSYHQMNWYDLGQYIGDLQQAGFDVARLSVQWHRKISYPLMSALIVLLAVPFAALTHARGMLGGLALALAIGIAYWAISDLFGAFGAVGQLPPLMAAWAPNTIFAFLGAYLFLKMPT
jgi:LPS export ABC transporter permease LptF/LPS export ABC transporter permease LptG